MKTECTLSQKDFHGLSRREIVAKFDGGQISSDGGGLLLREVERRTGILRQLSEQFTDYRDPDAIEHSVSDLVSQRVYGNYGATLPFALFPSFARLSTWLDFQGLSFQASRTT